MSEYYVGGHNLRDIQHVMLLMMVDIDRVCVQHNIRYFLDGGTMLGAIRHHGFIPWDDDLDIAMPRDDYEKFVRIANSELSNKYEFQCIENTVKYPYNFGKVRAIGTLYREEYTATLPINHGIYIDVFPMDYVDVETPKKLKFIQRRISNLTQVRYGKLRLSKRLRYIPFRVISLKASSWIVTRLMKYHFLKKGDYVQKLCHFGKNKPPINISMFNDLIRIPFEGYEFNIPREYDRFLTERYGDYMKLPPIDKRQPCHEIREIIL